MRIQEIEKQTGLTRKAIRFYEEKGLISVGRSPNGYRVYSKETCTRLMRIACLRRAGISVASLQLWNDGVISEREMLVTRMNELRSADERSLDQRELCRRLLEHSDGPSIPAKWIGGPELADGEDRTALPDENSLLCLGIDIGTTTLSAALIDINAKRSIETYTIANDSAIPGGPGEHLQDADRIFERIRQLLESLVGRYPAIRSIGISAQMHGIVYTDADGHALSPLATWQDERAASDCGGESFSMALGRITEKNVPIGYGLATHYTNLCRNRVPAGARCLVSIGDYILMRLCGLNRCAVHSSMAASFGLFDTVSGDFDRNVISRIPDMAVLLPDVTAVCRIEGYFRSIPVCTAIGDNQASFRGSVRKPSCSVLANFGTGSQISVVTAGTDPGNLELRPYLDGTQLFCGSALCGGRAYALLERFFGVWNDTDEPQYERMNRLAMEALSDESGRGLAVRTTFCGTRTDPSLRGRIDGIGEENFTPGALIAGVLTGMADELHTMLGTMMALRPEKTPLDTLIASGNAVRKNPALVRALAGVFGMDVKIPAHTEEAAYGAALIGAEAAGLAARAVLDTCIAYQNE